MYKYKNMFPSHDRGFIVDGIDVLTEIVKQAMNKDEEIPF